MAFALFFLLAAPGWAQHTYYVSSSAGADTHTSTQAQTKATAWANLPGMQNATSIAAAYTHVAGDHFVLMGCDHWTSASFTLLWNWSGSAGSPITVDSSDHTWYNTTNCPSAWNRPVWDLEKAANNPNWASYGSVQWEMGTSTSVSYVTLADLEMKGLYCATQCNYGALSYARCWGTCTNITYNNLYLHGWNVVTDGNCMLVLGSTSSPYFSGSSFNNGIIDGSDATGASPAGGTCAGLYAFPTLTNSVIHDSGAVGCLPPRAFRQLHPAASALAGGAVRDHGVQSRAG